MICINCQKWLRNQTKVKTETDYYCVVCFSKVLPSCTFYQIIGHDSFDVLGSGWPARHDLLMLMALEKYLYNNIDLDSGIGWMFNNKWGIWELTTIKIKFNITIINFMEIIGKSKR